MPTNISDIPNELFVKILWLLVLNAKPSKRYRVNRTSNRYSEWGFLAVTEVCSRWRKVALAEPKLWSLINLTDEKTVEQCLLRSQNALLRVSGSTNFHDESNAMVNKTALKAVVEAAPERIILLKAIKTEHHIVDFLRSAIRDGKMKALRELEFNLKDGKFIQIDIAKLPHLECLSFNGRIAPILRPHCFAGLRVLNLRHPKFTLAYPLAKFLDSFGTCQKLQELSFIGAALEAGADISSASLTPRHFPSLTRISIGQKHSKQSYQLLDYITTPQDQDLHFVLYARDPTSLTDTIPPHFLSLFSQPSTSSSRHFVLSIDQINPHEIRILLSSDRESSPKIFMALYIIASDIKEHLVLEEVAQMFGPVRIKGLEIRDRYSNAGAEGSMKQSYRRLYEAFPSVERLHIKACKQTSIQALAAEATGVHPFKNLQDLEIMLRSGHGEIAKSLLKTLGVRCNPVYQSIKKLTLHSSGAEDSADRPFTPEDLLQLRNFAEDVYLSREGASEGEDEDKDESDDD